MPTEQQWTSAKARARLYADLRAYFSRSGFLEVDTPLMVPLPGLEPHIDPFEVKGRYLHTSPEYAMKRLLADPDAPPLFQICKVFRDEPPSVTHNPEFTMLEFYRPHADYRAIMEDLEGALSHASNGQGVFAKAPYERLTVHEAMRKHAGVDWRTLRPRPGDSWDDTFFRIFLDQVEPRLGHERPVFLTEYPASMASLARLKTSDPTVSERVELYANGVELANGFSELVDAQEQRRRLVDEQRQRREAGRPAFVLDEQFLEALSRMPPSAGIAVGLDRVLMLLTGMTTISDVLLFPAAEFPAAR
jgi:lysyl-tRNA synthetase class 2